MAFYLTTAIDYVNSRPHLGTAYEKITADVIARYRRLCGIPTRFLMGNDEHSQNVYQRSKQLGMDPGDFCDQMETEFRKVWSRLEISFDDFIRTTEVRHKVSVTAMVKRIAEADDLYEGFYKGWYCVSCEAFKQEKDLVDGKCPVHKMEPKWIQEKNYFFRLSKYRDALLDHFERNPKFLQPDIRRNEMLRLLETGLEDISVSRTGQSWGIPMPYDSSSVVYVWVDALINYVSAVGFGVDDELFARWWPADLHVIGKDITRFHCIVWPAMLMSAGLPTPGQVFGHGWVHFKGQKMSKSLGTIVDPLEAADRLGPDPLRLYLVKEIPYGHDGDFTWERFEERYNTDLANNLGNLVNRLSVMVHRYRQGRLTEPFGEAGYLAEVSAYTVKRYRDSMERYALHDSVGTAYEMIDVINGFITKTEPWVLARDPKQSERLNQVLYEIAEAIRVAAVLLLPVMPTSCAEILRRVGDTGPVSSLRLDKDSGWNTLGDRIILRADPLWPRLGSTREVSEDKAMSDQS